jgi:hypothetical protein
VLTEFARFYGASFADLQNVAAFTCVEVLGGVVDIPTTCARAGILLKVRAPCESAERSARAQRC